ncbi:MAG TPA: flagellin [Verrucomicrobiae bacterium]|jgi:flagellin|nr:flagellin [Verrucomicrobiae bacterium]
MVINTNMSAQSSARLLMESSSNLSKSLARLSSGSKIVSPEDDVAGQAVATRFEAQLSRIDAASSNLGNAISFSQTQDGFLDKVAGALNRMSELTILAQDATKSDTDRGLYNQEFTTLANYISDLATKDFNGVSLFDGAALDVTIDSEGNTFTMAGIDLSAATYTNAIGSGVDILTVGNAGLALDAVKAAISQLSADRAGIGANVSRLTSTADQLGVLKDNLTSAKSRITDVDVADESTQYARFNILVQAGTAMLAQANSMPQSVLKLLS